MSTAVEDGVYTRLDPASITVADNIRFKLKKERLESLKDSIMAAGGVNDPIDVEDNGDGTYTLTAGHYRLNAVLELNKGGAGLDIPAIVHAQRSAIDRLKRQVSENMDRENLSPIDTAIAMKRLLDNGVPKGEVRSMFKRPGVKNKMQPASNSFVNMTISFLDLPKKIQAKIDDGTVGVAAAYELRKAYDVAVRKNIDPDEVVGKIIEQAEEETLHRIEQDQRDEQKLLEAEAKAQQDQEKREQTEKELEEAKVKAEQAAKRLAEIAREASKAFEASKSLDLDAEARKQADEEFRAKNADAHTAEKEREKLLREVAKLEGKVKTAAETAADRAAKLKEARDNAAKSEQASGGKKSGKVDTAAVKKAAKEQGVTDNYQPLTASEMRKFVSDLRLPGGDPKLIQLGNLLHEHFSGVTTENQCVSKLNAFLGIASKKAAASSKK